MIGSASSTLSFLVFTVLPLLLTGLFVWGFVDVLMRSERQFGLANQSKKFWLLVLGIGGVVYFGVRVLRFYVPFGALLSLGFLIAAVYYLGPERSRMGPRWKGGGRGGRGWDNRGGW